MPEMTSTYEILTGPAKIYYAETGTAMPAVDQDPGVDWTSLGETDGGVRIAFNQTVQEHRVDQRTGPVKAVRSEEEIVITTNLVVATLENLSPLLENEVDETAAGPSTAGYKELGLYRGVYVQELAFVIRGKSAYGDYSAQYELPRGYIAGNMEMAYTRDDKTVYPVEIHILEDLSASDESQRFGVYKMMTAEATS